MAAGTSAKLGSSHALRAARSGHAAAPATTTAPTTTTSSSAHANTIVMDVLLVVVSVVSTLLVVAVVLLVVLTRLLRRVAAAHRTPLPSDYEGDEENRVGAEDETPVDSDAGFAARGDGRGTDQEHQPLLRQHPQQRRERRGDGSAPGLLDALCIALSARRTPRATTASTSSAPPRSRQQRSLPERRGSRRGSPTGRTATAQDTSDSPADAPRQVRVGEAEGHCAAVAASSTAAAAAHPASVVRPNSTAQRPHAVVESVPCVRAAATAVAANDGEAAMPFHAASQKDLVVFHTTHDSRYRLLQRIGMGAFSSVYLVQHKTTGQRYALKYILCKDDRERLAALRECEVIHCLQGHPQVIRIVDMFMNYQFQRGTTTAIAAAASSSTAPMRVAGRTGAAAGAAVTSASLTRHPGMSSLRAMSPAVQHARGSLPWQVTSTGNATLRATSQHTMRSPTQSPSLWSRPAPLLAAVTTPTSPLSLPDPAPAPPPISITGRGAGGAHTLQMSASPTRQQQQQQQQQRPAPSAVLPHAASRHTAASVTPLSPSSPVAPTTTTTTKWVGVQLQGLHDNAMKKVASASRLDDDEVLAALRARLGPVGHTAMGDGLENASDVDTDNNDDGEEDSNATESENAPLILSAADTERLLMDARLLQQRRQRQRAQTRQQRYNRQRSKSHTNTAVAVAERVESHSASAASLLMPRPQQQQQLLLPPLQTAVSISVLHASRSSSRGVLPSPSTSSSSQTRGSTYAPANAAAAAAAGQPWRLPSVTYGTTNSGTTTYGAQMRYAPLGDAGVRGAPLIYPAAGATGQPVAYRYSNGGGGGCGGGAWDMRAAESAALVNDGSSASASFSAGAAAHTNTAAQEERGQRSESGGLLPREALSALDSERDEDYSANNNTAASGSSTTSSSGVEEEPVQPIRRILVPPPSYMHPPPGFEKGDGDATAATNASSQPTSPTSYASHNRYANFAQHANADAADTAVTPPQTARATLPPSFEVRNVLEAAIIDADVDAPTPAAAVAAAQASLTRFSNTPIQQQQQQQQSPSPTPGATSNFPSALSSPPPPPVSSYAPRRALASASATATAAATAAAAVEKHPFSQTPPSPALVAAAAEPQREASGVTNNSYAPTRASHYVNPYLERANGSEMAPSPRNSYAPGGGVRYNSLVVPAATPAVSAAAAPSQPGQGPAAAAAAVVRNTYAPLRYGNLAQPSATAVVASASTTQAVHPQPRADLPVQQQQQTVMASSSASTAATTARTTSGRLSVSAAIRSARAGQQGERMHLNDGKPHVHVPTPQTDEPLVPPRPFHNPNELNRTQVLQGSRARELISGEEEEEGQRRETATAFADAPSPQQPLYTNLGVALADSAANTAADGYAPPSSSTANTITAVSGANGASSRLPRSGNVIPSYGATETTAPVVRYANAGNPTLWCAYGQPGGAATGPASVAAARATAADDERREAQTNATAASTADGGAGGAAAGGVNRGEDDDANSSNGGTGSTTQSNSSSSLTQDVRDTGYLCLVMEYHPMGDLCHYVLRAKQQLALQQEQQQAMMMMRNSVSHATLDARTPASPTTPSEQSSLLFGGDVSADPNSPTFNPGSSTTSWVAAAAAATWRVKPATRRSNAALASAAADDGNVGDSDAEEEDPTRCNPLTEPQLLSIAYQLSSVLNHMHHQSPPIIHRDLKPENILITGALTDYLDDVPAEAVRMGRSGPMSRLVSKPASPLSPPGPNPHAAAAAAGASRTADAGRNAFPERSSLTPQTPSLPSARGGGGVGAAAAAAGVSALPPIRITRAVVPIVLTDFGLAMVQESHGRSHAGRGGGTRPYIAPECWQGATCPASDVWSLGCVLYALATGRLTARTVRLMSEEARKDGFASRMLNDLILQKYSLAFASFVVSLLVVDPVKRPTAAQAAQCFLVTEHDVRFDLASPFFSNVFDL